MRKVLIVRERSLDAGTFGKLTVEDSQFQCVTGELPWRDNIREKSCIPPGVYSAGWRNSPKHGLCYHVDGVPGRDHIQIHSANLMGDVEKGFVSQLLGCIAPGLAVKEFPAKVHPAGDKAQRGVTASAITLQALVKELEQEPFELTIKGADL